MGSEKLIDKILNALEKDILPLTKEGIEKGNKVFGAAILRKSDLSTVIAGTNRETENPLWHGEISCINNYWAMPEEKRPEPKECIFLSTHEPCSMCLSAITWSGFDNFYYLFTYEDSRDEFNIPHDLNMLKEVFYCKNGEYTPENSYWKSFSLMEMIAEHDKEKQKKWLEQIDKLKKAYGMLSGDYQDKKADQNIPLA